MPSANSLAATCEDYNSDDSEVVPQTRFQANVAGQANVAAKRSHPSDLGNVKPVEVVGPDAASDSGYSSHTAATMSSADSAQSQKSGSASMMADPPPAPSPRRRPTALVDHRRVSSQSSPRKPLARSGSVSRRSRDREESECTVPNCQCGKSQNRRPPALSPLDSGLELNFPPFEQRIDRSPYTPPSPVSARQPPSYIQGSAVVQPAVSARRRSSSSSRARPVSYHAGVTPESTSYWMPGMQFPLEHGPPPSMSAHYNQPIMQSFPRMGATPPTSAGFYPPGHPLQTTPPYDTQRPMLQQRTSSQYNTRRPTSTYTARPLISYDQPPQPNSQISARGPSARYNDEPTQSTFDSSSSSEYDDDDDEYDEDTDRALMPPPQSKPKPVKERRPSIRHANTTNTYSARMTQSQTLPERNRERDHESRFARSATTTTNNSRASSIRRPSINGAAKAESYSNSNGNPKVTVENATSRRRQSYMGHEQHIELEAKHRDLDSYKDGAQAQQRRRPTDLDARRRDADLETKKREVEAYQQRTRGDMGPQLTESALKAAKRSSRIISGGSDVGSIHSKASSHDRSSRISQASQSNRTTVTNTANGEIKMRIDASTGVNLEFLGDMEGRTIRLNPDGDGYAELVIGAAPGKETIYPKDRASIADRVSIPGRRLMPRREAEEVSVRSRRSSRSGREERDRQPLGRRRRAEE